MESRLAMIVVLYENYAVSKEFFESLRNQKNKNFHLFISDLSEKKQRINTQGIDSTILLSKNLGFAYGVNLGLKKALQQGFTKFCVINDDTFFKSDFVDQAVSTINQHPGSLIGGKIYYAKGYEYHTDRYNKDNLGNVLWFAGGDIDWNNAFIVQRGVDEVDTGQYDRVEETNFLTGCLLLLDKSVIEKVGLLDENYFLSFEDADYCEKAKQKGLKLIYDPRIIIWHKVSQSSGGSGSLTLKKYQGRNRVIFGLKYGPLRTKIHLVKNYFLSKIFAKDF